MRESLKNKPAILYMARNRVTDDFYIGLTSQDIKQRRRVHLDRVKSGSKLHFHNALRKYGNDNFIWTKIGSLSTYQEALEMEKYLIAEMLPVYNHTFGGEGHLGYRHTDEVRKKISSTLKGREKSEETRKRLSSSLKGRVISPESRVKAIATRKANNKPAWNKGISPHPSSIEKANITRKINNKPAWNIGTRHSEETRKKLVLNSARRGKPSWNRGKFKETPPLICIEDNKFFSSTHDAAEFYSLVAGNIKLVCDGKKHTSGGKHFKWVEK